MIEHDAILAAFLMVGNMDTEHDKDEWWKNYGDLYHRTFSDPEVAKVAQERAERISKA